MKKITITILAIALSLLLGQYLQASPPFQPAKKTIHVEFNKNIEFMGFAFFLGSLGSQYEHNEELNGSQIKWKDWYAYDMALFQQYKSYLGNRHLNTITHYIEKTDGRDLIRLFLQVGDFPNATLKTDLHEQYYLPYSDTGDTVEARKNAATFLHALNQFYKEVNFDQYFQKNQKKYDHALQQIKDGLPDHSFIPAMEKFYQAEFDQYVLLPSLTIPTGMGFGAELENRGKTRIFNVFGPLDVQHFESDAQLDMGFGNARQLRELSTHEFGHSFVNQAIDQLPQEIIDATESLYEPIRTAMEDQGYINWKYSLGEHFVRAGEVLIARNLGKRNEAKELKRDYIEIRKFIYLPLIIEELERYDKSKNMTYQQAVANAMERLKALAKG